MQTDEVREKVDAQMALWQPPFRVVESFNMRHVVDLGGKRVVFDAKSEAADLIAAALTNYYRFKEIPY